jgi:hypothetical protein
MELILDQLLPAVAPSLPLPASVNADLDCTRVGACAAHAVFFCGQEKITYNPLHRTASRTSQQNQFVGDAYGHGIMHCEAHNETRLETITLV